MREIRLRAWVSIVCGWQRWRRRFLPFVDGVIALAPLLMTPLFFYVVFLLGDTALTTDKKLSIIVAALGVTLTLVTIGRTRNDKMEKVAEYAARLRTDQMLSTAFHDLVENYADDIFENVHARFDDRAAESGEKHYECFNDLQEHLSIGSRYYHPKYFQGTEEERRLDALFGYLNVIGYYYMEGSVPMKCLDRMLSYELTLISGRKVVEYYLNEVYGREQYEEHAYFRRQKAEIRRISPGYGKVVYSSVAGGQLGLLPLRYMLAKYQEYNRRKGDALGYEVDALAEEVRSGSVFGLTVKEKERKEEKAV